MGLCVVFDFGVNVVGHFGFHGEIFIHQDAVLAFFVDKCVAGCNKCVASVGFNKCCCLDSVTAFVFCACD